MSAVLLATIVLQVVDFLRELANFKTYRSAVVTQAAAWIGGIAVVVLASHADVAAALVIPGFDAPLGGLDGSSQVLLGLGIASLASTLVDFKQAIDRTDSAAKPPLLSPAPAQPPAP